jgi:hypothetical protein
MSEVNRITWLEHAKYCFGLEFNTKLNALNTTSLHETNIINNEMESVYYLAFANTWNCI